MPLVAAAVCPHPPLIVPEIATGAAAETADLRAACDAAVAHLLRSGAGTIVVVGGDATTREHRHPFQGSFEPWGAAVEVGPAPSSVSRPVERPPLSLLVGGWLIHRALAASELGGTHTDLRRKMIGIAVDTPVDGCVSLGAGYRSQQPWALLAMGDGSACRGLKSPGYHDPRAAAYDRWVAAAMAGADIEALLGLDPVLSAELKVAGRAPWQVLAGAARAARHGWRGEVSYDAAPYGVNYLVATWTPA